MDLAHLATTERASLQAVDLDNGWIHDGFSQKADETRQIDFQEFAALLRLKKLHLSLGQHYPNEWPFGKDTTLSLYVKLSPKLTSKNLKTYSYDLNGSFMECLWADKYACMHGAYADMLGFCNCPVFKNFDSNNCPSLCFVPCSWQALQAQQAQRTKHTYQSTLSMW